MLLRCRSSRVSVSARLRGRSHRKGKVSTGDTIPFRAVGLLLASVARRFIGVAIAFLLESLESRESLTQDSRSAVKARLFDPLRESFGEERCTPRRADESFTQDSNGAPLERGSLIRRRGSFGERRCTSRLAGVAASVEAVTKFQALGHARNRRLHSEGTVICAYVTSGTRL